MAVRFKHRVLRGSHFEGGKRYRKGDTVLSKSELAKKYNFPNSKKYEFIGTVSDGGESEETPIEITPETDDKENRWTQAELEALTVNELKELAEDEEVDLEGLRLKEEIVEAILRS